MTLHIYQPRHVKPFITKTGSLREIAQVARRYERLYGPCIVVIEDDRND